MVTLRLICAFSVDHDFCAAQPSGLGGSGRGSCRHFRRAARLRRQVRGADVAWPSRAGWERLILTLRTFGRIRAGDPGAAGHGRARCAHAYGGVQNQVFQVTAASLAALLGVSNPDGLDYQLRVSATIGELHQGGTSVATATLGQTDSVDWVPPTDQNGNINALSVVMQRGEYPDTGAVSVAVSVVAVNAPVNATPVAVGDSATLNEDTPFNLDVLANDTDQDNDALSVSSHAVPAHGSVATNNDGTLVYTPDPNFNGTDTFTYTVSDGNGGSDTGSVTLTVAGG